jgi:hypothetical protein
MDRDPHQGIVKVILLAISQVVPQVTMVTQRVVVRTSMVTEQVLVLRIRDICRVVAVVVTTDAADDGDGDA